MSSLDFVTWNINYSRRAVEDFAKYSLENRKSDVYRVIKETNASIVFLQEILNKNRQDIVKRLSQWNWHFEGTNSRNDVCCNGIGIKKNFLKHLKPKVETYNFNTFEKSAEKIMKMTIRNPCPINVHFPMNGKGRMTMAENLDKCLPHDKSYRIIIAGDINSFIR